MHSDRDIFEFLLRCLEEGQGCALVTIIGLEGTGPRPIGAHMAVSETGERVGYVTSGCLEEAVAQDALKAIETKTNEVIKYGENSRFLDFRLPCGGSLTFYIHVDPDRDLVGRCAHLLERREPFALAIDPKRGAIAFADAAAAGRDALIRHYRPSLKFVLIGVGAELETMTRVTSAAGYDVDVFTPDANLEDDCIALGIPFHHLSDARSSPTLPNDPWTAFVFLFHDHEREPVLLKAALDSPAFYIGALGSRRTHETRLAHLREIGMNETSLKRIHGPMGLIPAARDPAVLAISAIAEVIECFRQKSEAA